MTMMPPFGMFLLKLRHVVHMGGKLSMLLIPHLHQFPKFLRKRTHATRVKSMMIGPLRHLSQLSRTQRMLWMTFRESNLNLPLRQCYRDVLTKISSVQL
jgi:hypothetical protein